MAYVIRPYRDDDAEVLAEILASAITDIGPHATPVPGGTGSGLPLAM